MTLRPTDFIIDDFTPPEVLHDPNYRRGLVPRNYFTHPVGFYGPRTAFDMPIIPRTEWPERIKEKEANKSCISHIRRTCGPNGGPIPALDQNGQGFCWMYSGTGGTMLARALSGLPYVRLSGHAGACLVKNYRDEGGWGPAGIEWIMEHGQPSVEFWKEKSMSRDNDTPAMRENALLHRITEGWMDLQAAAYDRNMTFDQHATCLLCNQPCTGDYNDWSHSVIIMDLVQTAQLATNDPGSLDLNNPKDLAVMMAAYGVRGLNSWTDGWGDLGEFVRTGSKAIPDGAAAIRVVTASMG